jgi:chromosome segregation ATPase
MTFRFLGLPALALALITLCPSPAAAVDREHQQLEADIRMLQEQAQQLQQMLTSLGDALKQLTSRIDDQTALERKSFADGKIQMDNLSGDLRIVREKVDETNVRLGSLSQEVEALRTSCRSWSPHGSGRHHERWVAATRCSR